MAFALSAKLGHVHPHRKTDVVGRIIALLFGAQWLVFQVMLRDWDRVEVAARFFLGNDFADLYDAAGYFVSGRSPYLNANFITPPPSLYLPVLLHHLSFWSALIVFRTIGFILVVAAILWLCRELHLNLLNSALMIAIALTYGPFYTVLVGGNLDALMLAFLVFACARKVAVRGIFLGLSIGTKLYSLLLIPVLLLRRRWKEAFWALGALAALLLPFLPAESSTSPSQIVRRQLRHSDASGGFLHNVPNDLYRHPIAPYSSYFVDPAEQPSSIDGGQVRRRRILVGPRFQVPEMFSCTRDG